MLSRQTTEVRTLPVTLSPEQLAVKAQELAVAVVEADEQKRALALAAEGWKERKKALEAELHRREGVASGADPMGEELEAIAADGFQAGPGEEAAEPPTVQIIDRMQALKDSLAAFGGAKVDA